MRAARFERLVPSRLSDAGLSLSYASRLAMTKTRPDARAKQRRRAWPNFCAERGFGRVCAELLSPASRSEQFPRCRDARRLSNDGAGPGWTFAGHADGLLGTGKGTDPICALSLSLVCVVRPFVIDGCSPLGVLPESRSRGPRAGTAFRVDAPQQLTRRPSIRHPTTGSSRCFSPILLRDPFD